ncbi:MAG TPA: hypothetical protein PLO67_10030 [Saprospiraceae bacterium]|nr:hypothetical protein [Saprospiraceae bacterium]HPI06215.1 hypothetical protein [Saprospiraceae bacterium]
MDTSASSNAVQRTHALLRATGLTLLLLLLVGFPVSRFPLVEHYKSAGEHKNYQNTMDTLSRLAVQTDSLLALLRPMDEVLGQIVKLDKKYVEASSDSLRWQIDLLEKRVFIFKNHLQEQNVGEIGLHVATTYGILLNARQTIWDMRNRISPISPKPEDGGTDTLLDMQIEAVAMQLDMEAGGLENVRIKGWFSDKKKTEEKLVKTAQNLRRLSAQLRSI